MKKLTFLLLFVHSLLINGQCDVAITDVNLNTYEVTVEVINSEGCTANGPGGVNGAVTMLQIGYHLPEAIDPDNEVVDLLTLPDAPCSPQWVANGYTLGMVPTSNYPGWWYSPTANVTFDSDLMGDGLVTGDVVVLPLNPPGDYITTPYPLAECGDDLIDYWLSEGECIEFVVWQLNYGSTWHAANGGWAETANGYVPDPSTYQDQNCNNSWYMCRDDNPGAAVASPDFCEVILDECNDPIACNYNENWGEFGGFCIYCDTPNGEELCNNYQDTEGYWDFYFNTFDCTNNDYPGCTDPFALNFDDEATVDDGTCVYSIGPDPIIIDLSIIEESCQVLDAGILSSYQYEATLVNIGTEAVTHFCLSDFLGTTFNCFNGVSNLAVWIQPGDTITVSGTINAIGNWFEGQGNFMSITSVPGEIITGNNNYVFYMETTLECEGPPINCDTIYIDNYIFDTTYVEIQLPPDTITLIETEFVYDTTYVELPPDTITLTETEFVFVTDTVFEMDIVYITDSLYITLIDTIVEYQFIEIDCSTGLPCSDLGFDECEPLVAYIPNTFTPNNDGYNDVWEIVLDPGCWTDIDAKVYNRWGNLVWESLDPYYMQWDGSNMGSSYYVPDGVYYWTFSGRKINTTVIEELQGYVTIFR
ncbi:gliding motility-associated C-terminal domain-containing protein [Akkermansiaceae bacterium]|nr:gliding motility-associated C-terminal domain-containing protein [Akkermansiaceae bacterium]